MAFAKPTRSVHRAWPMPVPVVAVAADDAAAEPLVRLGPRPALPAVLPARPVPLVLRVVVASDDVEPLRVQRPVGLLLQPRLQPHLRRRRRLRARRRPRKTVCS